MNSERVYLDWAAATPLLPAAYQAMEPYLTGNYGNPSAIHAEGVVSRQAVEQARAEVAAAVQVRPEYVTWTSGGTEGNNLTIFGVVDELLARGRTAESITVISTKIEHPSVGAACQVLEKRGVQVRYVRVHETGKIDLTHLQTLFDASVVLVTTALVNSEIGTIQPSRAIHKLLAAAENKYGTKILFHLDAAQAPLWINCQFDSLAADLVTFDAAKCCGPKGVGVLVRSRRAALLPVVYGGGQESGLRPGTENVAGVVGAARAITWAQAGWKERAKAVAIVRDQAIEHISSELAQVRINGAIAGDRVANNINISIPGLDTEFTAVVLDKHGFAVSTKSACSGAGGGASAVVLETTQDPARAAATLRITLGPDTTAGQLELLAATLKQHCFSMQEY